MTSLYASVSLTYLILSSFFALQGEDSAREESYEAREREREEVVGKQRGRKVKG